MTWEKALGSRLLLLPLVALLARMYSVGALEVRVQCILRAVSALTDAACKARLATSDQCKLLNIVGLTGSVALLHWRSRNT